MCGRPTSILGFGNKCSSRAFIVATHLRAASIEDHLRSARSPRKLGSGSGFLAWALELPEVKLRPGDDARRHALG